MPLTGLPGKKIGMLSYHAEDGTSIPCTAIEIGPCFCVDIRTKEKDGYDAVQVGFEQKKEARTTKPALGYFKKRGLPPFKKLSEVRFTGEQSLKTGDKIQVQDVFQEGMFVDVTGTTKGRGFGGVVKRWGFGGGPATHGQSDRERHPGSLGRHGSNSRDVPKGKKMAGHYGVEKVTTQNLQVVKVLGEQNAILVRGSVAGANGSYVFVNHSKKIKGVKPITAAAEAQKESGTRPEAKK